MNTADVAAEVKCLRRLIGMRCSNVYDLSPKTYVFKLMNSSGVTESGESEKVLLLMESGVRLHTTAYVRDKSNTPSGFTLKLRKHIRARRLEDVRQLGYDRIIMFQFGLGANAHYVILELYAQGNILLADSELMVLTLLRSHRDDDKGVAIMSRHRYPTEICRIFERTTAEKLQEALTSFKELENSNPVKVDADGGDSNVSDKPMKEKQGKNKGGKSSVPSKNTNEGNRAKQATLKTVLGEVLGYGPALSEHIILDAGLVPNTKFSKDNKLDEETIQALVKAVAKTKIWAKITLHLTPGSSVQIYDDKIESQKSELQQKTKEGSAIQKLNKIRLDQENRVEMLRKEVDRCVKMAELIEYNLDDVNSAILAVRVALAKGMGWEDLARMVKDEKKAGNPVAGLIDKLHFEKNCMTLLLSNNLDEMDDDEKTLPVDKVEVDLALSAHANARRWYELKKKQESKQEKTVTAHEKAFKAAEKKTRLQLSQEKAVATISHMRKVHWFEKFNWFISSENYLVISGRDAQQNEMIVKRYVSKGDLYVHADLHGASSTVIKNHRPEQPVPPLTLNQAGCFTVCHSQAWDSKILTSAWWVYPHQVSKTAPTGEYLTVGSFMIHESSLGSHLNERRVRGEEDGVNDVEESQPLKEISESESESEEEVAGKKLVLESESHSNDLTVSDNILHESSVQETSLNDVKIENLSDANDVAPFTPQLEDLIDRALGLGRTAVSSKNYGFEPVQVDMTEEHHEEARDKPYISKSERKKLKKGQRSSATDAEVEQQKEELKDNRGAFGWLYWLLLGIHARMMERFKSGNEATDKGKISITGPEDALKVCYKCKKVGHLSRDCPEHPDDSLNSRADGAVDKSHVSLVDSTSEVDRVAMEEEDIHEIGEEERERLNDLDFLTGNPLPVDILSYAVPVCGPYNAVQSYKYRVKIIPGTVKKGKAAKTAMNLFSHMPEATSREKELMKACTDPELVAAIVGNVKITAAGLTQLKQKQKKVKKNNKG
ncbi:hypothetical protein OIU77_012186 [Salix suchowensis]|uniref:CCHC-type domain-containing protein n=1 Tax=Salix suchowensis TaxID=1278906 RepID=A0ABQ9A3G3_9ROSI|nr:hypothetical protein OIU77_012186 [Salix suchowensis]